MKLSTITAILVSIVFLVVMATKATKSLETQYKALSTSQQALLDANI